jgi:S1-C subfamily serine protease
MGNAEGRGAIRAVPGQVTGLNQVITASEKGGSVSAENLHGMIETNADIVPGDPGGPLSASAGVIGMDTAGNSVSYGQASATGFAIPINTALSVARQIAAGHASPTITIGYPPFIGIFIASGSSSNPQKQAQQQNRSSGGSGSTPRCYTSNADLTVPSTIAPLRSGILVDGTVCGSPAARDSGPGGTSACSSRTRSTSRASQALMSWRPELTAICPLPTPAGQPSPPGPAAYAA